MNKLPFSVLLMKGKMLVSFVLICNQWISYVSRYNLPRERIAVTLSSCKSGYPQGIHLKIPCVFPEFFPDFR